MYKGMIDCIRKTYRNEGILAFYKGYVPMIIKVFPQSGIMFLTYELLLSRL